MSNINFNKREGETLRHDEWNALGDEIARLENKIEGSKGTKINFPNDSKKFLNGEGEFSVPTLKPITVNQNVTVVEDNEDAKVEASETNEGITLSFSLPKGDKGDTGKAYLPSVSKSGDLSWSLEDTTPSVPSTNIKGPQGERGIGLTASHDKIGKQTIVTISTDEDNPETCTSFQINDGTDGHNPCLGRFNSVPENFPNATAAGDYVYVDITENNSTTTYIYYFDGTNWDTEGTEVEISNETFDTGEKLHSVGVDGSGLANPTPNALAKAEDIMPLAVKLKGITLTEDKVQIVEDTNFFDAKYIVPTTGLSNIGKIKDATSGNPKNGVLIVNNLDSLNIKAIRFLGFKNQTGSNGGSAWGFHTENITSDNIDTVTISDLHDYESGATTPIAVPIVINVPSGAKSFACTIRKMNNVVMTLQSFYCYLQTGEGVGDMIANVQPDEQLSTTSEKPIANKTITNFLFDNFTKEIDSEHQYTRPLKVSGDLYDGGMYFAHNRVYPVTPGKQYIVTAWQWYYSNIKYAYAGFYALPENYGRSDISASTVCKGKDGDADAPYTYTNEENKKVYVKNVILTAPEGATHLVLIESHERQSTENIVDFPANLRVVSVAAEQQEEEEAIESVKTALTPTPNALLMKNVLKSQNRNYYIESVDITAERASFESYNLKSYIDRKIATIPEGKHFMMWTDAHIDYNRYGGDIGLLQDTVPVMAYIKEKLGISYIINGGDNLGADSNQYKAAAIIEKYMIDCFEAFGRGLINVVGNHDWNKTKNNPKISDYETWKRMFQPMELFGDVVYAQNVLHNIETCELLTDEEKMNLTAWAKMNYYIDDNRQKIRYYVTVTDDPGSIAQGSEMINGTAGNFMVFVDFFAGALNTIPEGYDFVFVGHQRIVNENRNENNPYWIFYKLMGAWKKKTNVSLGGGNSYDSNIFHFYKTRNNKVIAKWITSGNWDDDGLRTFDFSNHKGSGRVFTLGGHYHRDRAAFTSTDNRVFAKSHHDAAINGNTEDGNILYDLEVPTNNAYAEAWADAILGIDVHCTTIGGSDSRDGEEYMIVHRYKVNNEWVEDPEVYDDGADWTGNEYKVYADYYGHRKSILWPIGGPETYKTADRQGTPFESVSAAEQSFPTSLDKWVGTKILIKESESAPVKVYHVVEKEEGGTTTYSIELLNYGRGTFGHYFDDATNNEVLADDSPLSINRIGNVNEICCDVITITDDNHVVCTRFGAGFDRDYKLPSIPSYSIYAESSETTEQTTENAGE